MFMDDVKLFSKHEDQIDGLINAVITLSEDIKMKVELLECNVLTLKIGKLVKSEGISMANRRTMKHIKKGGYKFIGLYGDQ